MPPVSGTAVVIFLIYFLPAIVGVCRKRKNANAIAVANLIFGWTILGWGVCLVWAMKND
jgi:hypothetical protein